MPPALAALAPATTIRTPAAPPRWMKATAQRWRAAGHSYLSPETPASNDQDPRSEPRNTPAPRAQTEG